MPKIIIEREKCIGCGTCVTVCPMHFKMAEDGLAKIKDGEEDEKNIEESGCSKEAAQSCPVQCIHVKDE